MSDTTIQTDVDNGDAGDFDPVAAFLKDLTGGEEPTQTPKKKREGKPEATETAEEKPDEPEDNTDAEEAEGSEDPEGPDTDDEAEDNDETPKKRAVTDEDEVEVVVDGEARRASIKDLKRLYGQEAALTRKSQEVAQLRKAVETQEQTYKVGLQRMAEAAEKRWKEFEAVDYLTAKDAMSPQDFANLRQAATQAYQEHKFFTEELASYTQKAQAEEHKRLQTAAVDCVKALRSDTREDGSPNPLRIEGWSDEVYNGLRTFAVSELGADQRVIDSLVDPVAIKVLWMAQQYAKAQKAAAQAKKAKPTVTAPKKALTSKTAPPPTNSKAKQTDAIKRLQRMGTIDAGADAFLASFGIAGDED